MHQMLYCYVMFSLQSYAQAGKSFEIVDCYLHSFAALVVEGTLPVHL